MSRSRESVRILVAMAGLAAAGCGDGGPPALTGDPMDASRMAALSEVGELYRVAQMEGIKTPKKAADLAKFANLSQVGFSRIKEGEVVVLWGVPLAEGDAGTVLAYGKEVPEAGGYVLMRDGMTVKKMTAEEFQNAPKAAAAR